MEPKKKEKKTNSLINVSWTKDQKMIYFLWLDEQVMHYWSLYLDLKMSLPDDEFWPHEDIEKLNKYLELIEYFEEYQKEITSEYTYEEIDMFVKNNPKICDSFTFFRFFLDK